jgi:hypothetical protein
MRRSGKVSQSVSVSGSDFGRRADRRYLEVTRNKLTAAATAITASKASTVGRAATRYSPFVWIDVPFNFAFSSRKAISRRMRTKKSVCDPLAESMGLPLIEEL